MLDDLRMLLLDRDAADELLTVGHLGAARGKLTDQLDHAGNRSSRKLGLMRVVDTAWNVAVRVDGRGGLEPAG